MIATVAARTGIAPLELRDAAVADSELFDEVARAAAEWTPQLELAASNVEVTHELYRVVLQLGGAKTIPKPLALPRSTTDAREHTAPPRVSVRELAELTGRRIGRAEA